MKQFSYKDVKLLRQIYKTAYDQLNDSPSKERCQRVINILNVMASVMDAPGFPEELNSAGEPLMTAFLQIFRVRCGMFKDFVGDRMATSIDMMLYLFTRYLPNYTRRVKQTRQQADLVEFYKEMLGSQEHFLLYASCFRIWLTRQKATVNNLSSVPESWAGLISNMVGNLKKTEDELIVGKVVAAGILLCTQNRIFCKEFVKNGVLPYLLAFVQRCTNKALVSNCIHFIVLLTGEREKAKLLIENEADDIFVQTLARFNTNNFDLTQKVKGAMDNILKFREPDEVANILVEAKTNVKKFNEDPSAIDKLTKSLQRLKVYSLSDHFAKYLVKSEAHRWLAPLLSNPQAESVHDQVLEIIGCMLGNKEQFKNPQEIFNAISAPMVDYIKNPRESGNLERYLKAFENALKKDLVNPDFIKKSDLVEQISKKILKNDKFQPCHKLAKSVLTLLDLKLGTIKQIPLEANRKNKDIKELETVSNYLDVVNSMGIEKQVKKEHLETIGEFLNIQESDYPNEKEEEVTAMSQEVYSKMLTLLSKLFVDTKIVQSLSSSKLFQSLVQTLSASPDLRQSLDLLEIMLASNPNIKMNLQSTEANLVKIVKSHPLNEQVLASCGEIMHFLNSPQLMADLLKDFDKNTKNPDYLDRVALYMCTIPDEIPPGTINTLENVIGTISSQNWAEMSEELQQKYLLLLNRLACMSSVIREKLIANSKITVGVEGCFAKPALKQYVLDYFATLAKPRDNVVHRGPKCPPPSNAHLSPIKQTLTKIQKAVLEHNTYTLSELRFLQRLAFYESKSITEGLKIKTPETVTLAGQLFARVIEENKQEAKKALPVIEQLNKQLSLDNKNIQEVLKFLSNLQSKEHYGSRQKLQALVKEMCSYKLEDFTLYPDRLILLRLCLDCLADSLDKNRESGDMSSLTKSLEQILQMLTINAEQKDGSRLHKTITGGQDVKQQTVQAIYRCLSAVAGVDIVRVKISDQVIKYMEKCENTYIIWCVSQLLEKVAKDDGCQQAKQKLKEVVNKRYQQLSKDIIQEMKPQTKQDVKQEIKSEKPTEKSTQKPAQESPTKTAAPKKPVPTVIPSAIPSQEPDMSKMSVEVAIKKAQELLQKKDTVPGEYLLSRIVDALREEKTEQTEKLLTDIFMKYQKQQQNLNNTDRQAINRIAVRIQQYKRTTQYIIQKLETRIEVVEVTEKIKLLGDRALRYAIKIFKEQPAFASKIIEYNLVSEREFQIIEKEKIPQQILEVLDLSLKNSDIDKYICLLIGTAAKAKSIQEFFAKSEMPRYLMEILRNNRHDAKIIANCFYALAGLTFCLESMTRVITTVSNIQLIMQLMKDNQKSNTVVESGSCLVSNLCYHNDAAKRIYFECNVIDHTLQLFKLQLEAKQYKGSTFKQMLRVLGNCSLLVDNAKKMVTHNYVPLSSALIEIINYKHDLEVLKYVVQVYSNLSSHTDADFKVFLATMFKQGSLDMLLTLLETNLMNADIIAACIDSIDGMCQEKEVERVAVDKKLIPLLLDILKTHEANEKIVVKGIRVISNLTLDKEFIQKILQANVPGVVANLLHSRKLQKNKLGLYVTYQVNQRMKIITRIFNARVKTQLVMRSGYIDCVLESLRKQTELYVEHLEILICYAKDMGEFISNKTFQTVVPVLQEHLKDELISNRCITLLKLIDREADVEPMVGPLSTIYCTLVLSTDKSLSANEKTKIQQLLNLLIGYLSRSTNLKAILRERNFVEQLQRWSKKYLEEEDFLNEAVLVCTIMILNVTVPKLIAGITRQESEDFLMKGLQCKLYRRDSTFKKAIVNMTSEYELRSFKYPDGEIKEKYRVNILNIKDSCFRYNSGTKLWELSVFSKSGGLFEKKAQDKLCCTIIGPVTKSGAVMLNLSFDTEAMKDSLQHHIYNLIRHLKEK